MTSLTQAQANVLSRLRANPGIYVECSQLTINSLKKRCLIERIPAGSVWFRRDDVNPKAGWRLTPQGHNCLTLHNQAETTKFQQNMVDEFRSEN